MKYLKQLLVVAIVVLASMSTQAQEVDKRGNVTINIQTTAECEMCKERIEQAMYYHKGVKLAELALPSKVLTVKYKQDKTSAEAIRKAISDLGYAADELKADKEAYDALPHCCKVGQCTKGK